MSNSPPAPSSGSPHSTPQYNESLSSSGPRPVLLLKVKRKVSDQSNPTVIQLHRIIEQFDVFPDEISEAEYRRQRKYQNNARGQQQGKGNGGEKKEDEELVSLLGGVRLDAATSFQVPLFDPTQPETYQQYQETQRRLYEEQKKAFEVEQRRLESKKYPASGYISDTPSSTSPSAPQSQNANTEANNHNGLKTLSQIQLDAQKNSPAIAPTTAKSTPFSSADDFKVAPGYDLRSQTLFRKVGVANKDEISSGQLQNWYSTLLDKNHNNITSQEASQDTSSNPLPSRSTEKGTSIAMFEVETLDSAHRRITSSSNNGEQGENGSQGTASKDSTIQRLYQLYGSSVQVLLNMEPVQDTNYTPKQSHGAQGVSAKSSAGSSIAGLKPPPQRRGGASTGRPAAKKDTTSSQSLGSFGSTSALLDDDTMHYLRQRTLMAQHEDQVAGAVQEQNNNEMSTHSNTHTSNTTNTPDGLSDVDDVYDIYEVCADDYQSYMNQNESSHQQDQQHEQPHVVIPRLELDYVIAVNQVDSHLTNAVHQEFLSQFTKPRLNFQQRLLHHISQSHTKHRSGALRRKGRGGGGGGDDDDDDQVEGIERGFYDDDHHPDFDSDMDYPDTSDDDAEPNRNRTHQNDEDGFGTRSGGGFAKNPFYYNDEDDSDNPHDNDGNDDDDDAAYGFYANPYDDDDDDDDDYNNGNDLFLDNNDDDEDEDDDENDNNDWFRYGGIKTNPNAPQNPLAAAGLSLEDLDSQDPLTRELVMHAYRASFRANQRSLDQAGNVTDSQKLAGQTERLEEQYLGPKGLNVAIQDGALGNNNTSTASQSNNNSTTMGDNNNNNDGLSEKINQDVFQMLFGDDDDDDDSDSDSYGGRPRRHQNCYDDDEEDPYGGTNTFRQFKQNKAVYEEQE